MKNKLLILTAMLFTLFMGCSEADLDNLRGESDDDNVSAPTPAPNSPAGSSTLGPQIDRAGRPGVSTALIATFEGDETKKNSLKTQFNAGLPANGAQFSSEIAKSLAIYDALAGQCGDNALTAAAAGGPTSYQAFANVLADDQIYVNGASGNCTKYLGVELGIEGSCGGRIPSADVINVTYSAVALGAAEGVSDGVSRDDRGHSTANFPFLAAPQRIMTAGD